MGQCGISPLSCSHWMVCSPSQDDVTFPSTLLAIPQAQRGVLFLMEVKGLWPPTSWSHVTPGRNECSMPGHISRRLLEMDQAWKIFFLRCIPLHDIWYDVDENLWPNALELIRIPTNSGAYTNIGFKIGFQWIPVYIQILAFWNN